MGKVNTFCERSEWEYQRVSLSLSLHHCLGGLLYNFIVIVHYIINMLYSLYTTCYAASSATRATSNTIDVTHSMNTLNTLPTPYPCLPDFLFVLFVVVVVVVSRTADLLNISHIVDGQWFLLSDSTRLDLLLFWFCLHLCRRLHLRLCLCLCSLSGVCCRLLLL